MKLVNENPWSASHPFYTNHLKLVFDLLYLPAEIWTAIVYKIKSKYLLAWHSRSLHNQAKLKKFQLDIFYTLFFLSQWTTCHFQSTFYHSLYGFDTALPYTEEDFYFLVCFPPYLSRPSLKSGSVPTSQWSSPLPSQEVWALLFFLNPHSRICLLNL